MRQLVIIGSGPAGWTAAIYAARADLAPLVVASSVEAGGELMKTTEVENYPGFAHGVQGPELMEAMRAQAERFGAEIVLDDVTDLQLGGSVKTVSLGSGEQVETRAVIFATGSAYRRLGVAGEDRLSGRGVSWCATCDGFFFRGRTVAVIGGGDSALEEATFLSRFADRVHLVHRGPALRASKVMQARAAADPKIELHLGSRVESIDGDDHVTGITLAEAREGGRRELEVAGVFVAIGSDPRTHLVHGQLELTGLGTVRVEHPSSRSSAPGVFAAGDVVDARYRQAVTAAASGTVAALDAEEHLAGLTDATSGLARTGAVPAGV